MIIISTDLARPMLRMKGHTQLVLRQSFIVSEVPQVTSPCSWSTLSESPFPHFVTFVYYFATLEEFQTLQFGQSLAFYLKLFWDRVEMTYVH